MANIETGGKEMRGSEDVPTKTRTRSIGRKYKVESKVKRRIEELKASDRQEAMKVVKAGVMLPLEDLYAIPIQTEELPEDRRERLREMAEKDLLISHLRAQCVNLAIKYADAENTIDEIRFGMSKSQSLQTLNKPLPFPALPYFTTSIESYESKEAKRTTRAVNGDEEFKRKLRKSTSVECFRECKEVGTTTDFTDPILKETCSNWLERVQNWKTEASNKSHDSNFDIDSGFRSEKKEDLTNTITTASTSKCHHMVNAVVGYGRVPEKMEVRERKLDALLEETTLLAKRVKSKSMKLANMLKELDL